MFSFILRMLYCLTQNAHAYVNAAFRIKAEGRVIKDKPALVFGGINASTVSTSPEMCKPYVIFLF